MVVDDNYSGRFSYRSDSKFLNESDAARVELGKLREEEIISLLRTLYLKSDKPELRQDDHDGRPRSHRSRSRRGSRSRSGRDRGRGRSRSRGAGASRGTAQDHPSLPIVRSRSRSQSRSRKSKSSKGQSRGRKSKSSNRGRLNFFGMRRRGDNTAPSNIELDLKQNSFEYLNDSPHYPPDHYSLTPSQQQYFGQYGRLPGIQSPGGIPGPVRVRGEAVSTPEPVDAIVHSHLPSHNAGPHNTVLGQHVGPPRVNTIRGTSMSPIVEATDYVTHRPSGGAHSAVTPTLNNLTPAQLEAAEAANRAASRSSTNSAGNPPQNGAARSTNSPPLVTSMSDPNSLEALAGATAGLPRQIIVDPYPREREYIASNFKADQTLVSDVSSSKHQHNPWTRSPNSVVSEVFRDFEPRKQCWVRGSVWYDALHYACTRICCGEPGDFSRSKRERRRRR
jgi:hypothetical protein